MASLEELRAERLKKLARLRAAGVVAYPVETGKRLSISQVLESFSGRRVKDRRAVVVVGRINGWRPQGGVAFFDLRDGSGQIQVVLKEDEIGHELFDLFCHNLDRGDWVAVRGRPFLTERKVKSLSAMSWRLLAKSLRPLPTEWYGLKDVEERYRRRYLDSVLEPAVAERFRLRGRVMLELRTALDEAGYLEVETPILQPQAGGATATPFVTHHSALDQDFFLRISPELYLKRLLVGGFERVYELGRSFRNEGIDATHQPEFTMLEFYAAYSNAREQMKFVETLLRRIVKRTLGHLSSSYQGQKINWRSAFKRITYFELLRAEAGVDNALQVDIGWLQDRARQLGAEVRPGDGREKILDLIYKKACRPKLIDPTFITDYPKNYLPLAKQKEDEPELVDAFQLVVSGLELVKAFSELNDPEEQARRFAAQDEQRAGGDAEAQSNDADYVEALEYGLPPCGGVGLGLDRLLMLLADVANIREVIFFPTLRSKQ